MIYAFLVAMPTLNMKRNFKYVNTKNKIIFMYCSLLGSHEIKGNIF